MWIYVYMKFHYPNVKCVRIDEGQSNGEVGEEKSVAQ